MNWRIDFSRDAFKFLDQNNLKEDFIIDKIKLALEKFKGEDTNIDIKKLKGEWEGLEFIGQKGATKVKDIIK